MKFLKRILNPCRTRANYWTNSNFSDWVTKTFADEKFIKPTYATMEEWDSWRELYQTVYPKTYWVCEEFLGSLQNFLYYPIDVAWEIKHYLKNRFIDKSHLVQLPLEKGIWHEYDTKFVESIFALLIDFVESDTSMEYLKWAATLTKDAEWGYKESDPGWGQLTDQAIYAQKIIDAYEWIKVIRPSRPNVWENYDILAIKEMKIDKIKEINAIEQAYYEEDTKYAVEIVQMRQHIWN